MFDTPSANTAVKPAEELDYLQKYLVKLKQIVNQGPSNFKNEDGSSQGNRLRWEFFLGHADGHPVKGEDGEPYVLFDWTSSRTGKGKNGTKTATARKYIEALLGRAVEDHEITANLHEELAGKTAIVSLEERQKEDGTPRIAIVSMGPRQRKAPVAAAAPAPVPPAQAEYASDLPDVDEQPAF